MCVPQGFLVYEHRYLSLVTWDMSSLVPRVLRLLGQRTVARRDSGVLEFFLPQKDCGYRFLVLLQ